MAKRPGKTGKTEERGLFDSGPRSAAIARMLEAATQKAVKASLNQHRRQAGLGRRNRSIGKAVGARLSQQLSLALSLRHSGKGPKGKSLKLKSKDGGRPFHFRYSSISRESAGLKPASGGSFAAQHHRYIERELAVEAMYEPGGKAIDSLAKAADKTIVIKRKRSRQGKEIDDGPEIGGGTARDAQSYIERDGALERPVKLANGEVVLSSFGNIGQTIEERVEFWDKLAENERADGRVQNRVIAELPHESTPEIRRAIVKKFVEPYETLGLRYHIAIHAPGKNNDDRNFHVHLVFSERPAKRMPHPETGKEVWDFEIAETYKSDCRHNRVRYPYRQKRVRELQDIGFVQKERKRWAQIVNAEMKARDPSVKYDPRSYKDMGIDATPLTSINRVLSDNLKDNTAAVLDPAWMNRLVAAELQRQVELQNKDALAVVQLRGKLEEIEKAFPDRARMNKLLPKNMQLGRDHDFTKPGMKALITQRLKAQQKILEDKVILSARRVAAETIFEATDPKKFVKLKAGSIRTTKNQPAKTELPDVESMTFLHEAAGEELAEIEKLEKQIPQRQQAARRSFFDRWMRRARPNRPTFEPAGFAREPARGPSAKIKPDSQPIRVQIEADAPKKQNPILDNFGAFEPEQARGEETRPQKKASIFPEIGQDPNRETTGPALDQGQTRSSLQNLLAQELPGGRQQEAGEEQKQPSPIDIFGAILAEADKKVAALLDTELRGDAFMEYLKKTLLANFQPKDPEKRPFFEAWVKGLGRDPNDTSLYAIEPTQPAAAADPQTAAAPEMPSPAPAPEPPAPVMRPGTEPFARKPEREPSPAAAPTQTPSPPPTAEIAQVEPMQTTPAEPAPTRGSNRRIVPSNEPRRDRSGIFPTSAPQPEAPVQPPTSTPSPESKPSTPAQAPVTPSPAIPSPAGERKPPLKRPSPSAPIETAPVAPAETPAAQADPKTVAPSNEPPAKPDDKKKKKDRRRAIITRKGGGRGGR